MTETQEMEEALERLRLVVRLTTIHLHNANPAYTVRYDDCDNDGYSVATDLDNAASEVEHLLAKVGQERDQAVSAYAGMKEALEFYAKQWEFDPSDQLVPTTQLEEDAGHRAASALSALPTGEAVTMVSDLQEENARLREALAFYADPYKAIDAGSAPKGHEHVPDFYTELCFGDVAEAALAEAQPLPPVEEGVPSGSDDPYARGVLEGVEAAAKLVVGWREIEPRGDEYERWDFGCKLVADELAERIRSDGAAFASNVPSPSKERVEKLEAALEQAALEIHEAANVFTGSNLSGLATVYFKAAETHRALLETEGK